MPYQLLNMLGTSSKSLSLSGDFFPPAMLQQVSWVVYLECKELPRENTDAGRQLGGKEKNHHERLETVSQAAVETWKPQEESTGEENYKRFFLWVVNGNLFEKFQSASKSFFQPSRMVGMEAVFCQLNREVLGEQISLSHPFFPIYLVAIPSSSSD